MKNVWQKKTECITCVIIDDVMCNVQKCTSVINNILGGIPWRFSLQGLHEVKVIALIDNLGFGTIIKKNKAKKD